MCWPANPPFTNRDPNDASTGHFPPPATLNTHRTVLQMPLSLHRPPTYVSEPTTPLDSTIYGSDARSPSLSPLSSSATPPTPQPELASARDRAPRGQIMPGSTLTPHEWPNSAYCRRSRDLGPLVDASWAAPSHTRNARPDTSGAEAESDRLRTPTRSTRRSLIQLAPSRRTFVLIYYLRPSLRLAKHDSGWASRARGGETPNRAPDPERVFVLDSLSFTSSRRPCPACDVPRW